MHRLANILFIDIGRLSQLYSFIAILSLLIESKRILAQPTDVDVIDEIIASTAGGNNTDGSSGQSHLASTKCRNLLGCVIRKNCVQVSGYDREKYANLSPTLM
jgi:hypothetical protein